MQSVSKMLNPNIVGKRHYEIAYKIRQTLAEYEELKDIIAMLGIDELSQEDQKKVKRAQAHRPIFDPALFYDERIHSL